MRQRCQLSTKIRFIFGPSDINHGKFRTQRGGKFSKQIIEIITVSDSGRKAQPIFIISGMHIMASWFQLVEPQHCDGAVKLQRLTKSSWFPKYAVVFLFQNGSIGKC